MNVAIYTAIFGEYDTLKEQPRYPGVDYVCFADRFAKSNLWQLVVCKGAKEHPRISAKRFKATPHLYLDKKYDVTIWIDGSIRLLSPEFVESCTDAISANGFAVMRHPFGKCVYQEALGCVNMPKYRQQRIFEQTDHYRKDGYPEDNGLAACGIVVRDMRRPQVAKLGEDWLRENLTWSYQDQISLPYVLWKNGMKFDELPFDYHDRRVFALYDHASEE